MLRRAKENYFKNSFNNAIDNPSKTWQLLKDKVNNGRSKKMKGIGEIKEGDSMNENTLEIAEHFNSNFCLAGAELDSKIPGRNRSPLTYMGKKLYYIILFWYNLG